MDVLRAALGDTKLTYLGKSYGTYLGTWYAQLFPSHVRALVLDGAIDPGSSSLRMNIVQGQGFEVALRAFVADCVARRLPVGRGPRPGGAGPDPGADRPGHGASAGQQPVGPARRRGPGAERHRGGPVQPGLLADAARGAGLRVPRQRDRAGRTGQRPVGTQRQRPVHEPGRRQHGGRVPGPAVACQGPGQRLARWRAAAAARSGPRRFGAPIMWGSLPCALLAGPPGTPRPSIRAAGAPPILVVGNERRPGHPVPVGPGAGPGPGAPGCCWGGTATGTPRTCGGSSCVDGIVNQYLLDLAVPPHRALPAA